VVIDRTVQPGAAVVAWTGATPRLINRSYVPVEAFDRALARIEELEREREEDLAVLVALTE
jgi:hypothetical protein